MPDFIDVRDMVLSGQVHAKKQAVYLDRLGGWFTLQELMGDEKGDVLNNSIDQKTGRVNIKLMYAELFIRSLRYPVQDGEAPQPIEPAPLGVDQTTDKEQAAYDKALAKYQRDVEASTHPYTTDHPRAGELVFKPLDRDAVNLHTPGEILERVAETAMVLNGLSKSDLEEKKATLNGTVIDSTLSSSQNVSDTSTQT